MRTLAAASLAFFLALAILDLWLFRNHLAAQRRTEHRVAYYAQLLLELWLPTLAVLAWVGLTEVQLDAIGLRWFQSGSGLFPRWLSAAIVVVAGAFAAYSALDVLRLGFSPRYRATVTAKLQALPLPAYVTLLMPRTRAERTLYGAVAISAGITEEILYRGFLLLVLATGFPALGILGSVVVSSALFGLGHLYQGPAGMLRTAVLALVMCAIYLASGTLLLCMLIHALIDVAGTFLQAPDGGRQEPIRS